MLGVVVQVFGLVAQGTDLLEKDEVTTGEIDLTCTLLWVVLLLTESRRNNNWL